MITRLIDRRGRSVEGPGARHGTGKRKHWRVRPQVEDLEARTLLSGQATAHALATARAQADLRVVHNMAHALTPDSPPESLLQQLAGALDRGMSRTRVADRKSTRLTPVTVA